MLSYMNLNSFLSFEPIYTNYFWCIFTIGQSKEVEHADGLRNY